MSVEHILLKSVNTKRYTASQLQKPTLLLFIQGQHANKSIPGELITESNAVCMYHNRNLQFKKQHIW